MKYVKRKVPDVGSMAAKEIKQILEEQEPPMGIWDFARLIGVVGETVRAVTNDERIPSSGFIGAVAYALKLDEARVQKLLDLREKDLLRRKIEKVTSGSGKEGGESMGTILEVLTADQIAAVKKVALEFALANRGAK